MKRSLKLVAAALAAIATMAGSSAAVYADSLRTVDGIKYLYSDSGVSKGKYTGWAKASDGSRYYYKNGVRLKSCWLAVNGVRTYYLRNNGKMATGDIRIGGINYSFDTNGKLQFGFEAKIETVTESNLILYLKGKILNNKNLDIFWDSNTVIERKNKSGEWETLPFAESSYAYSWSTPQIRLFVDNKPNETEAGVNIELLYGKLSSGEYRMSRNYYVRNTLNDEITSKTLSLEFTFERSESTSSDALVPESSGAGDPVFLYGSMTSPFEGTALETDYSNISAVIGKDVYTSADTFAYCDISDNNIGKAFYYYSQPYLEKLVNGKWVNVPLKQQEYALEYGEWYLCYIEGNTTKPNSSRVKLMFNQLAETITSGAYRMVVFVGDKRVYATFRYE